MKLNLNFVMRTLVLTVGILSVGCSDFFTQDKATSGKTAIADQQKGTPSDGDQLDLGNPNSGEFALKKMFANLAMNVFAKQAEGFSTQLGSFSLALNEYCAVLKEGDDNISLKSEAQNSWLRAMSAFHQMEGAPFGPLVANGRTISDFVYSWPFINTCGIDQHVMLSSQEQPVNVAAQMFNLRGLGAVEYLLFETTLNSKCNVRANPKIKEWNAQSAVTKKQQRCEWALKLVGDVEQKAATLKNEWSLKSGGFVDRFVNAKAFADEKETLNALTDALSNIEKLKDLKLGRPLGRHKECTEDSCPQDVEHIYSGASFASVEAQLRGFRAVFFGSANLNEKAFGFDDLLMQQGRGDVVARMGAAIDQALRSVRDVQGLGDFKTQIENMDVGQCKSTTKDNRFSPLCSVHADVREVAFLLKTEVLTALSLRAPPAQQGDND